MRVGIARPAVNRREFVPHHQIAGAPLVQIRKPRLRGVIGERFDQSPARVAVHGLKAVGVRGIGEQDGAPALRVQQHRRVALILKSLGLGPALSLVNRGPASRPHIEAMQAGERSQLRLPGRIEPIPRRPHIGEIRAATRGGHLQGVQHGQPWQHGLIGRVGVPLGGAPHPEVVDRAICLDVGDKRDLGNVGVAVLFQHVLLRGAKAAGEAVHVRRAQGLIAKDQDRVLSQRVLDPRNRRLAQRLRPRQVAARDLGPKRRRQGREGRGEFGCRGVHRSSPPQDISCAAQS